MKGFTGLAKGIGDTIIEGLTNGGDSAHDNNVLAEAASGLDHFDFALQRGAHGLRLVFSVDIDLDHSVICDGQVTDSACKSSEIVPIIRNHIVNGNFRGERFNSIPLKKHFNGDGLGDGEVQGVGVGVGVVQTDNFHFAFLS